MASLTFFFKKRGIKHLESLFSPDNVNNVKNYKTHKHKSFIEFINKNVKNYINKKKDRKTLIDLKNNII